MSTIKEQEECRCGSESDAGQAPGREIDFSEFPATNYEEWKEAAVAALKGSSFDKSMFTPTYEGITLEPLYTAEHTKDLKSYRTLPGLGNPLRGTSASGYISNRWEITQFCDAPLPGDANAQIAHELQRGATGISVRLDRATLDGMDPDAGEKEGEREGKGGVSLSTLEDLQKLFQDIDCENFGLHIHAGASSAALLGFLAALSALSALPACAKKRGFPLEKMYGCVGADPLGAWIATGRIYSDTDQLFDEMAHSISWTEKNMPGMRTVLIDSAAVHNGGANAVQEIAYVMASAIECARAMRVRHTDIDAFSRHLRFEFSLSSNFFMEIAKIRAAREIWAQIAEIFGGGDGAKKANIFGRTSFFTKTVYDPYVNMLRNTTEAFSGVLGGVDGMTVGCFDEAIRPADAFSRRTARNIQVLLREEFDLTQPVDPAGGSWYLESLTHALARKAWEGVQKIEENGGLIACIKAGVLQASVAETLAQRFKKLASRSERAVGTNMYPNTLEQPLEQPHIDFEVLYAQRKQEVQAFRSSRDAKKADESLKALTAETLESGTLIDLIAAAAESGATLGEVRAFLNEGNEEPLEIPSIAVHRWTEQYEEMRRRTEKFRAEKGGNVRIFLANMGPIPQHKARADFITGFMEVGNFEVLKNDGFPTVEECAQASVDSSADIAVICSTDDTYPELVPPLARAIKEKKPSMTVFLAGAPKEEFKQSYIDAGVDDFISVRSNCLATLSDLQKAKGMI